MTTPKRLVPALSALGSALVLLLSTGCGTGPTPAAPGPLAHPAKITRTVATTTTAKTAARARTSAPRKVIYLTFDDGPSEYTARVLRILARYDAKATFFVIGQNVGGRESLLRRAAREGHSVQNHTWDHADLKTLSSKRIRSEIRRTDKAIRAAGVARPTCVRPPYGSTNARVRGVLHDLGKKQKLWDVDPLDWARPGTDTIYKRVVRGARDGRVVLSHDGGGNRAQTVRALPRILKTLKHRGYRFASLCS